MKSLSFIILTSIFLFFVPQSGNAQQLLEGIGLDLVSNQSSGWFNQIRFRDGKNLRHVITDHGGRDRLVIYPGYGGGAKAEVEISGKVAIATTNMPLNVNGRDVSGYRLFVKGGILTDELLVATSWADYVFEEEYKLMSFDELRGFIALNGHLPNVPSGAEVESDGLELKSMTVTQQEKIEEAFLYILQLEEKINALETQLNDLTEKETAENAIEIKE